MIEPEGAMLIPADAASAQMMLSLIVSTDGPALVAAATPGGGSSDNDVLQASSQQAADEWILPLLSSASPEAIATGTISASDELPLERQENEDEDIVITGWRPTSDLDYWDGSGDGGAGGSGGGSSSGSSAGTAVAQHTQDCGTDDGAAAQVAKHVMGTLPPGVSGPVDPLTTSSGNDWTKVEFGAVIVRNPDGSYGSLNDAIYSSNQASWVGLPDSAGQPVQGIWHSHPVRDDPQQRAIDRYPSSADWAALARIGTQPGAVPDPSIWITGPDMITREFKLSERAYFETLDDDVGKMVEGEGLAGKERTQSCG
jgi:hypothetical protein